MTVFVSYLPGAKGKFVTEICDLSINPEVAKIFPKNDIHGGNIRWIRFPMNKFLDEHNIPNKAYHGIFPEDIKENYTHYIDTVLDGINILNSKFTVDTHYIEVNSLNYMLSKGIKVIRIVITDNEAAAKLANNFFFKNFMNKNKDGISSTVRYVVKTTNTPIKNNFNFDLLDKPLTEWDKDSLKKLYDICKLSTKLEETNIIIHENLLEVDYKDLQSINTLTQIIEFAGGTMNEVVRARIEQYNKAQADITTFDEYVENFLNNK